MHWEELHLQGVVELAEGEEEAGEETHTSVRPHHCVQPVLELDGNCLHGQCRQEGSLLELQQTLPRGGCGLGEDHDFGPALVSAAGPALDLPGAALP